VAKALRTARRWAVRHQAAFPCLHTERESARPRGREEGE
jgi:hypothetical protein